MVRDRKPGSTMPQTDVCHKSFPILVAQKCPQYARVLESNKSSENELQQSMCSKIFLIMNKINEFETKQKKY